MNKNGVALLVLWIILCGWLTLPNSNSSSREVGRLRSSITEAKYFLDSPDKEDKEYGKIILENAKNSLERNTDEDYSVYDPYFN